MKQYLNVVTAYMIMFTLIILVGIFQSWSQALSILNYCLISAVMTIGANIQWGYAGLINFGIITDLYLASTIGIFLGAFLFRDMIIYLFSFHIKNVFVFCLQHLVYLNFL